MTSQITIYWLGSHSHWVPSRRKTVASIDYLCCFPNFKMTRCNTLTRLITKSVMVLVFKPNSYQSPFSTCFIPINSNISDGATVSAKQSQRAPDVWATLGRASCATGSGNGSRHCRHDTAASAGSLKQHNYYIAIGEENSLFLGAIRQFIRQL